jgi:ubiquinone/menaquinone biosynthesis C-methylase UbiE
VLKATMGGNVIAPIAQQPSHILDVGTGSGAWPYEVAFEYPNTIVRGIDLSPIQPRHVPDNCEFIVHDLNDGL